MMPKLLDKETAVRSIYDGDITVHSQRTLTTHSYDRTGVRTGPAHNGSAAIRSTS